MRVINSVTDIEHAFLNFDLTGKIINAVHTVYTMPHLQIKIIYKSSRFYYCSNEICHSSLNQKALMQAHFAFMLFTLFWGVGGRGRRCARNQTVFLLHLIH